MFNILDSSALFFTDSDRVIINSFISVDSLAPFRLMRAENKFSEAKHKKIWPFLSDLTLNLCISDDTISCINKDWWWSVNSSCAQPPHPPPPRPQATAGHLLAWSVPGVGHLQILCCPGAGHLPTPGPTPSFWHARGFLSEYNYTEDFTGKTNRLAHLSRMGKNWRGM